MIKLPRINCKKTADSIRDFILSKTGRKSGGVIGLSGGVDSTVTAALAAEAYKHSDKKLLGLIMPSSINNREETVDAWHVAMRLDIEAYEIDISPQVFTFKRTLPWELNGRSRGNMTSRIRANILSTAAECENRMVIGTGNKDEDFSIGYYTLFGDGAVHCSPIAGLSKRHVYNMAYYLSFEDIAEKTPTAGLEPGQSDFKDLGYSYELVELVMEAIQQGIPTVDIPKEAQIIAVCNKDMNKGGAVAKFTNPKSMVADILHRHASARQKRSLLCPEAAEVFVHSKKRRQ